MLTLARKVRFFINPFLRDREDGCNRFASDPPPEGAGMFLELTVCLTGKTAPETGLIVNVSEIDKAVRANIVPLFAGRIGRDFEKGTHTGWPQLARLLEAAGQAITGRFRQAEKVRLELALSPFTKITLDCGECPMLEFSEKFEFAASHRLRQEGLPEEKNFELFGKCANPSGHGHNYVLEVAVKLDAQKDAFQAGRFRRTVAENFIELVDHRNLSDEIDHFRRVNPTVENIAEFAYERLAGRLDPCRLIRVTVWENDRTSCTYRAE
jgi:6-pyruvoyltetrahydropterin/6-carboxytetrahydropterin synthase